MKKWKIFVTVIAMALFSIIGISVHAAGDQVQTSIDPYDIKRCVVTMKQTVYNDGDKLNLDGLQMQLYDFWGNILTYSGEDLVTNADEINMSPEYENGSNNTSYQYLQVSLKGYEEDLYSEIEIDVHKPNKNDSISDDIKDIIYNAYSNKINTVYNVNDTLNLDDVTTYGVSVENKIRELTSDEYTIDTSKVDMSKEGEYKITIRDKENEMFSSLINVYVVAKKPKLTKIEATKAKTTYKVGDTINVDDLVVTGYYDDGSSKVLEPYSDTNSYGYAAETDYVDTSKAGKQNLWIMISEGSNDVECAVSLTITDDGTEAKKQLTELQCKSGTPVYEVGADIALKDFQLVVTAVYSDETTRILSENEYTTNIDELDTKAEGTYKLTISYTENGITKTTTATYVVGDLENVEKTLSKIVATKDNVEYEVDDTIDLDDLNVIAFYSDGTTKKLTKDEYTTNAASLKTTKAGKVTLKVTYKEGDVTKTSSIVITVKEKSDGTEETEKTLSKITAAKTTKEYQVGDTITTDDLTVTATYSDGTTRTLDEDEYTTNVASLKTTTAGKVTLKVTYKEGDVTKISSIVITVKEKTPSTPSQPTTPTQPTTPSQSTTTAPTNPSTQTTVTPSTEDTVKIVPGKVKNVKVKALGKRKVSIKWKKAKNGIAYMVQISAKKNFKGAKKKLTSETRCTINSLKKGKTYYVRIQAASFDKKWSSWSAVKKVKVK